MTLDEELTSVPVPRGLAKRQADAHNRLESGCQLWLATGSDGRGAHLIPVAYVWDGSALYTATIAGSRTVTNVQAHPRIRVAIGDTADVVMIDASASLIEVADIDDDIAERYTKVSMDPRAYPAGTFVYLCLRPQRILVWNGLHERAGRTVMVAGRWLESSVD